MVSYFHGSLLCRSFWLNSLPSHLASPICLWIFTLSVALLKQLAAVLGLTFCMDPCTIDSLKRGIQHDESVRVALMVGSERICLGSPHGRIGTHDALSGQSHNITCSGSPYGWIGTKDVVSGQLRTITCSGSPYDRIGTKDAVSGQSRNRSPVWDFALS